jgi:hypothetical protein
MHCTLTRLNAKNSTMLHTFTMQTSPSYMRPLQVHDNKITKQLQHPCSIQQRSHQHPETKTSNRLHINIPPSTNNMSSETPTTPSPAANPHSLILTLDEFLASVYAVQTLFVELYQNPDPNNADYYNPPCWIELVSSPPLTAQIPFPTFIAPLLSESDVLDGTILQHLILCSPRG